MLRLFITALFLGIFFIASLPAYLILRWLAKLSPQKSQALSQRMVTEALRIVLALSGTTLEVKGLSNIPKDTPVLYIGNHTSYFDIVSTYPLLPSPTGYVAKKEIDRIALLRWWMPLLHGLTFDRQDPRSGMRMILSAIEEVKKGYSIFIFPEGTRAKDGEMADFKAGSFKVATRTGCPIVPVAIKGTADIFENHIPFVRPSAVSVTFGEPVMTSRLSAEEKKHLASSVQNTIREMLA